MLNLAGRYEKKPASDPDGFLRFAEGLSTPTVYNAIKCAQRLGNIARYRFPASTWRHFEGLASFPRGLIPDMSPCRDTFLPMNQYARPHRLRPHGRRGRVMVVLGDETTKAERVCMDSPLEGTGFELSVPREVGSFQGFVARRPTCRATN